MAIETRLCMVVEHESLMHVLCPLVGVLKLLVSQGQFVQGGQAIADARCLNKHWRLLIPEHVSGHVEEVVTDVRLAYRQQILLINQQNLFKTSKNQAEATIGQKIISAPMDGMIYLSPSPQSPAFVAIGDEIKPGQTIGLIEVMKCFYPFKYQGTHIAKLTGIKISSGTPVNSGMVVFEIA